MQTTRSLPRQAAVFGLAATALLSSCSLPPREAWRQIRQDGLITFMANGMSAPKGVAPGVSASGPMLASSPKVVEPAKPQVQPVTPASGFPQAYAVKDLAGYVRTPYTNPPRLVDVRGMGAGSKVVCPYTQKPFVVPAAAATSPAPAKTMLASSRSSSPPAKTAPAPVFKPQPAPISKPQEAAGPPKLVATNAPAPVKPPPTPASAPAAPKKSEPAPVVKTEPKKEPSTPAIASTPANPKPAPEPTPKIEPKQEPAPAPQTAAAPAPKLPFGAPIPGRPGFVNSPFAEKHQLVDVTGLSVGTEVKCPYTGKLFRVPPQAQAKR